MMGKYETLEITRFYSGIPQVVECGIFYSREVFRFSPMIRNVKWFMKCIESVWNTLGYSLKEVGEE